MILKKKVMISLSTALIIFVLAMGINIIPCQIAPKVPNPTYKWEMCSLNPDNYCIEGATKLYFGYTESLTQTYLISIIVVFLAVFVILHLMTKQKAG